MGVSLVRAAERAESEIINGDVIVLASDTPVAPVRGESPPVRRLARRRGAVLSYLVASRKLHRWAALVVALPTIVVVVSGILLSVKKDFDWIQPVEQRGLSNAPSISFDEILEASRGVAKAQIEDWNDIDRIDVRPDRGVLKIKPVHTRWEIQIDTVTGSVLQVAYRRSDLIESIHDGSFFHEFVKRWVFLPTAVVLAGLWGTGLYLFLVPYLIKRRKRVLRSAA